MNSITLSICIPTYSRGVILYHNLNHNLNLSLDDVELVISDNDSKNDTEILIRSIKDKRIKYFKNDKNLGYDINLLKLVERANGSYILLLSDEDLLNIKEIEKLVVYLRNNQQFTLILGSIGLIDEKNLAYHKYYQNEIMFKKDKFLKILSDFSLFHYGYMSGIVLKKSSLKTNELYTYNKNLYTHYCLMLQALNAGPTLCTSNIFCYLGHQHETNFILNLDFGQAHAYQLEKRIQIIKKYIKEEHLYNSVLNSERNMIAYQLAWFLHDPFSIYKFFILLPHIFFIKEMKIKKVDFWLKVFLYIPLHIMWSIINHSFLNKLSFTTKYKILKIITP
jgi:GT2 family glycosyltransferase